MAKRNMLIIKGNSLSAESNANPSLSAFFIQPFNGAGFGDEDMKTLHKGVTHKRASRVDLYSTPIIVPGNYKEQPLDNQTKNWYIMFRYRKDPGKKMHVIAKRVDLNYFTGKEKIKRAEYLRNMFERALHSGVNPFDEEINEFDHYKTKPVIKAIVEIFIVEENAWSKKTISTYNSSLRVFETFIKSKMWSRITIPNFTKSMAKSYSDWLLMKKYDITTHNNHLRMAGTFFGFFVDRDVIDFNPFSKVKKKRDGDGGHLPFSDQQMKTIKEHCRKNYPAAYLFTLFAEDSLLRSGELRKLQVGDIDFTHSRVRIVNNKRAGMSTKDKETRHVEISESVLAKMKEHVKDYPADYLVFGKGFMPYASNGWRTDISKEYTTILRQLKLGAEFSLYSWRHTGAHSKFIEGWNPYRLMNQLGHNNWETTRKYLRKLGVTQF